MAYAKEQRWEQKFEINGTVKTYYPRSEEQMKKNLQIAKDKGYKKISSQKLYPFNTYKNQHNFSLINDICFIRMHDMQDGEIEWDQEEYDRLESLRERSEKYFCAGLPVAWVPWETWKDMKELSEMAIIHRQNACIENGRPDLVTYC